MTPSITGALGQERTAYEDEAQLDEAMNQKHQKQDVRKHAPADLWDRPATAALQRAVETHLPRAPPVV